jgi:hypothetical protein
MMKVGESNDIIESLRNETPLTNPKLGVSNIYIKLGSANCGNVSHRLCKAFILVGYGEQQVIRNH